ncbi:hypothetical protein [Streptomyces sp. NPDC096311]|uniref:hypothetical protein n=1 Tax=Streptomyces sp. NPDC096311 TaxID=3366083 RepID=UPI00380D3E23
MAVTQAAAPGTPAPALAVPPARPAAPAPPPAAVFTARPPAAASKPSVPSVPSAGEEAGSGGRGVVPLAGPVPGALAHRYAVLAPPLHVALAALRLEALLGDPLDAANPYSLPALAAPALAAPAGSAASLASASAACVGSAASAGSAGAGEGEGGAGRAGALLAAAGLGQVRAADQRVRALRPLLRRDLALGHAAGTWDGPGMPPARRARGQAGEMRPANPVSSSVPAALLGPAALVAAAGSVLRQAALTVAGRAGEPALRQWQPVLAAAFADLLACESLTCVALRRPAAPGPEAGPEAGLGANPGADLGAGLLGAVAGYVVPTVLADVLAQLGLVLAECGHGPASTGGGMLAKLTRDLPLAGVDAAGAAYWQACLVRALPALAAEEPRAAHRGPVPAPFRLADPPAPAPAPAADPLAPAAGVAAAAAGEQGDGHTPDGHESGRFTPGGHEPDGHTPGGHEPGGYGVGGDRVVLSGLLRAGAARADGAGGADAGRAALGALARRLLTEQRALRRPCRTAGADPGAVAARALADRQALLWLAAAVLGVREAADDGRGLFLGGTHWALLALSGIAGRLGVPLPGDAPDPRGPVWAELAGRVRRGVDCDVYATRLLW